ncbi:MAG: leucyl aminopeptidase [Spirochaetes bacterium]|nr:leucyl aminopeptidase [Spirochaetota bacterium]
MKIEAKKPGHSFKKGDTILLFMPEPEGTKKPVLLPAEFSYVSKLLDLSYFKGKQAEVVFAPLADRPAVIICGTGKQSDTDAESLRRCVAGAVSLCREKSIKKIHVLVPAIQGIDNTTVLSSIAEGIYLSNYSFDRYKTKNKGNGKPLVETAVFHTAAKDAAAIMKKTALVCGNTLLCRDLINEISEKCDSRGMAREAKSLERIPGVSCTVYGKREIEKMKMGLLLAVNKGSAKPPMLVVLKYRGGRPGQKYVAIVGKGITFDSGGINLKPSGHIEDMRTDMAGAAAALYALKTAAELKLPVNLYAVLPLTDNMISPESFRPGDVYTAYDGTTVEIGNTDAEGRLILADALSYAVKVLRPEVIIDIATLTGSCLATFGEAVACYLTTDDDLGRLLEDAAASTGEAIWRLPFVKEYDDNMKSDIADICNMSSEKNAGTIMGGIFLKHFAGKGKWAHIDIASTARATKQRGYRPKEATGFGVRLLVETIINWKK